MNASLDFELPEDHEQWLMAVHGSDWWLTIWDLSQEMRRLLKYGNDFEDAEDAIAQIARSLKPGGRFVAEFGGKGNVQHLLDAMERVFAAHPEWGGFENPWYFPSIEEYATLLQSAGFVVESIELIPRPTPMDDIMHWLDIFANGVTEHLSREEFEVFKRECRDILKPILYSEGEGWIVDYVRLRVKATKGN